eukprot:14930227-Alexandrium_andersonii.AAC.1
MCQEAVQAAVTAPVAQADAQTAASRERVQPPSTVIRPEPAGLGRRAAGQRRMAIGRRTQREAAGRQSDAAAARRGSRRR